MENDNVKKSFGFGTVISWIAIIIFIIWGAYSMGKNSDNELTPQELRENNALCNQWTGEDCPPYSAD